MGSSNTKELNVGPKANYNPDVEIVQEKIFEPHYGEVKIVKDKETEQLLILKETVVNTKQAYDTELTFLNNRIELRHPNVAEIVGYNAKDQQNFCSTYYKIQTYIEVLENTLQTELENRISTQIPYNESEILLVADSLISGLSYFQSQGFAHGDIRPYNVFVQGNTYKLSDPSLTAHKGQHGLHLAIIQGQKSLLAPELVEQVPKSDFEIRSDRNKADVFSLGITILSLATLSNLEDIYDLQAGTFNEQILTEKLESIRYRYSPFTWDFLKSMVTITEAERPDFVALSNTLLPYQDQIRASAGLNYYDRTEGVKRAGLEETPGSNTYDLAAADDLEARIKAALERSEATFKAVTGRVNIDSRTGDLAKSYVSNTGAAGGATGTTGIYGTTNYGTYGATTAAADLNKSGVNQTTHSGVNQGLSGSGVQSSASHNIGKQATLPEGHLAQSGTYNSQYVPAPTTTNTYQYSATYPTAGGATDTGATGSYTPGGSYNYTSSYVPAAAYTTNYGTNTDKLANSTYGTTPVAYGTSTTAAYGTGNTPKAQESTSGVYGTYGNTSGTYGASTTPKAHENTAPAHTSGVYGSTAGAAYGTAPSGTYGASNSGVYGSTGGAPYGSASGAYGTSTSGAYGTSTTPKAQETATYTPTAIYGSAAYGTGATGSYGGQEIAKPEEEVPAIVETTVVETTTYGDNQIVEETNVVETTTNADGQVTVEDTTTTVVETVNEEGNIVIEETTTVVETVTNPEGEVVEEVITTTTVTETVAEEPAAIQEGTYEQPAAQEPAPEEVAPKRKDSSSSSSSSSKSSKSSKGFFEKVKDAVEDVVEKVGDAIKGDDKKEEEEHKEAEAQQAAEQAAVEAEAVAQEEVAAQQEAEQAAEEQEQRGGKGKRGKRGKRGGKN